jgi:hypothetical protein
MRKPRTCRGLRWVELLEEDAQADAHDVAHDLGDRDAQGDVADAYFTAT